MVIQFSCPGCQQPIEVDGEWAGQHVACPFCQRVVTAPTESTLRELGTTVPPMARRAVMQSEGGAAAGLDSAAGGARRIARLGLSCSLAAIVMLLVGRILLSPLTNQLGPNPSQPEAQQKFMELLRDPQMSGRIALAGGVLMASFGCWVTGLVLSIIGASSRHELARKVAIAGLACSGITLGMCCLGSFFG